MKWVQLRGGLNILWHCPSLGLEWKLSTSLVNCLSFLSRVNCLRCHSYVFSDISESVSCSVCLTLCNPMNCSPPGSSIHGIFQAKVLEWGAIEFVEVIKFQLSYFKFWKMMLWKCCMQYASKFGKLSSGHRTGKSQFSFQSQRKAMPKNAQTTAQLHSSHTQAK